MEQSGNYAENYRKNRPPYIIVDSSFLLSGILDPGLVPKEFLSRCKYLFYYAGRGVRILPEIRNEIVNLISPYCFDKNVQRGLRMIKYANNFPLCNHVQEHDIFKFLSEKIREIGYHLPRSLDKPPLSENDIIFGAYSILKTLKGHVIPATCDKLLEESIKEAFKIAHPALVSRGYQDTSLQIAHSFSELESILSERKKKNLSRIIKK